MGMGGEQGFACSANLRGDEDRVCNGIYAVQNRCVSFSMHKSIVD